MWGPGTNSLGTLLNSLMKKIETCGMEVTPHISDTDFIIILTWRGY